MPEDYTANSINVEEPAPQETAEQGSAAPQKDSGKNGKNASPQNKNESPAEGAPQKENKKPVERAPLSSENSALVEKFRQELLIAGYSQRTLTMYMSYVSDFLGFIKKHAPLAVREDLVAYLAMLKEKRNVSNATLALALASLKFFFHTFLHLKIVDEIKIPKKARKLPVVLTKDEVRGLIKATKAGRNRLIVEFIYSTGARVSEAVNIKVNDLELREGVGVVRGGKGKKDRIIILSKNWISEVKRHLKHKKVYSEFVFSKKNGKPLSSDTIERIVKNAAMKAGLQKDVHVHTLRHSYATHLLEAGENIRKIQELLGHASLNTTQLYTKVSTEELKKVKSPLDDL